MSSKNNTHSKTKKEYYDWDKAKEIPILDVCAHFGIELTYRSGKPWCRIRPGDKTPSTSIHVEAYARWKANTFYDFGSKEGGDNITLACRMLGLDSSNRQDRYTAMVYLSKAFHIPPRNSDNRMPGELTNSEYRKIGLYGDLATKNFKFDFERKELEEIQRISETYDMPMNQLKKEHPRTFERLLKTVAIPYFQEQRNNYYMDLWLTRRNVRISIGTDLLESQALIANYDKTAKELQNMEHILNRAISGTRLKPMATRDYAPAEILAQIDSGRMKPEFGSKTYQQMQRLAKSLQTTVKFRSLDLVSVYYEGPTAFGNTPFSAFMSDGKAIIGYLEKDKDELRPIFEHFATKEPPSKGKRRLNDKLQAAKKRMDIASSPLSAQEPQAER